MLDWIQIVENAKDQARSRTKAYFQSLIFLDINIAVEYVQDGNTARHRQHWQKIPTKKRSDG
eukprot:scaffold596214_cov41-Prasinocladus_malaysianus.AAC.1